ncbi:hypothetical protein AB0H42_24250 [Nocardia sp. NPDC050799]|uniref:hypothetical protein n=1 Tax=Nocardia sp. NPDC050799 TaxID=3154842 RepID=UPI0033EEC786
MPHPLLDLTLWEDSVRTLSSSAAATSQELASRSLPTAAELDGQIKRALDPALPDSERTALIADGEAFAQAIPDMYKALQDNPRAVYGVTDPVFDNHDGTVTATLRLDKDGSGTAVRTTVIQVLPVRAQNRREAVPERVQGHRTVDTGEFGRRGEHPLREVVPP